MKTNNERRFHRTKTAEKIIKYRWKRKKEKGKTTPRKEEKEEPEEDEEENSAALSTCVNISFRLISRGGFILSQVGKSVFHICFSSSRCLISETTKLLFLSACDDNCRGGRSGNPLKCLLSSRGRLGGLGKEENHFSRGK
jgi:hypothetical protein